jgi:NodT family efflux transporter outer membrane factor (OMF) lipoprotein
VRSLRNAADLDAIATRHDLRTAAMTLSAQIAKSWYRLIEKREQLRLLDAQIKTNEEYLKVITKKFAQGQAGAADVLQQEQLVESTKGERTVVEASVRTIVHQLAVLVGASPVNFTVETPKELAGLPPLPQTGIPANVVQQRPDVRSATARIYAANNRLAAAIADRFPRLDLTARAQTSASKVGDLFDDWLANLAGNIAGPIFDAGLRRAEVNSNKAVVAQRLHTYGETVLTALKEVEDALVLERKQAEYIKSVRRQLDLSEKAVDRTRDNYTKGAGDFTRYLTTRLSHERLQRTYLQAQRLRVEYRIDLYRAVGGGWSMSPPGSYSNRTKEYQPANGDSRSNRGSR